MPTPGETLRRARLERGLSLEAIAVRTKIRVPVLERLEQDAYADVAGGVFVRGFIAAFAREVGLDPAAVVAQYIESYEPSSAAPSSDSPLTPPARRQVGKYVHTAGVALVIAVTGFAWTALERARVGGHDQVERASVGRANAANHNVSLEPAVLPAAMNTAERGQPDGDHAIVVEIQAIHPLWLEASPDGRESVRRLLAQGEEVTVEAQDEVSLVIGDVSAVRYTVNGVPAHLTGSPGEVRRLHITRDDIGSAE
jgi:hypothetical protein